MWDLSLCSLGHWPLGAAALLSIPYSTWSFQQGHGFRWPRAIPIPVVDHMLSLDDWFITAPAHPHATWVAVYPVLFKQKSYSQS